MTFSTVTKGRGKLRPYLNNKRKLSCFTIFTVTLKTSELKVSKTSKVEVGELTTEYSSRILWSDRMTSYSYVCLDCRRTVSRSCVIVCIRTPVELGRSVRSYSEYRLWSSLVVFLENPLDVLILFSM